MKQTNEEIEMTECKECENGTRYLSNLLCEICCYCEGTGEVELES